MNLNDKNITGADELMQKLKELATYIENDVPEVIGTESVSHFKNNFERESFDGSTKWKTRATKRSGSTNNQKTLSKSSDLSESIDYKVEGKTIIVFTDKVYAQIHNEGGEITVTSQMKKQFWALHYQAIEDGDADRASQFKSMALAKKIVMPQRQFIGESQELIDKIVAKLTRDFNKIIN